MIGAKKRKRSKVYNGTVIAGLKVKLYMFTLMMYCHILQWTGSLRLGEGCGSSRGLGELKGLGVTL